MLEEQINKDYIQAMKNRDKVKSSTLNFLRAQMKNAFLELRVQDSDLNSLKDEDVIAIIKKQVKQRQDSISQFEQGGRQDLVDKESEELELLKKYLPEEISEAELETIVASVIGEVDAKSMKDMGTVMKSMAQKVQGRADNKLISELVKRALSQI